MNEQELEELMKLNDQQKCNQKKLKSAMNKSIYSRIFKVILAIALIFVGIQGYKKLAPQLKNDYDPRIESQSLGYEASKDVEDDYQGFKLLMQKYIEMKYPNVVTSQHYIVDQKNGNYEYHVELIKNDRYIKNHIIPNENAIFYIHQSKLNEIEDKDRLLCEYHIFRQYGSNYNHKIDEKILKEIKKLPDSSILDVDIRFNEIHNDEQVIQFIKEYDESLFTWLAIQSEEKDFDRGINIYNLTQLDLNENIDKKYPGLYCEYETMTKKDLYTRYESELKLLLDHKKFLEVMGSDGFDDVSLQKRLETLQKEGIQSTGICGIVTKKDLLQMIEKDGYQSISINDVKLSSLQK